MRKNSYITYYVLRISMYLHIGKNRFLWSEAIVGIFDASVFAIASSSASEQNASEHFLKSTKIIHNGLQPDEIKSCIVTESNEVHLSSIHYRTLTKRWINNNHK